MNEQQKRIYDAICGMPTATDVVDLITNVCGTQILDDDMEQELVNLGYLDEKDED